jgi:hypothetical protein
MGCILVRKRIEGQDWCDLIVWDCQPGPERRLVVERKTGEGRAITDSKNMPQKTRRRELFSRATRACYC